MAIPDFASGESGTLGRRTSALGAAARPGDGRGDARRGASRSQRAARRRRAAARAGRVGRAPGARRVGRRRRVRARAHARVHDVDVRLAAPRPGRRQVGEPQRAAGASNPLDDYDWLLIFDDDVVLPRGFLDAFLFLCERFDLTLAQPAHKHWSHAAWRVTRRRRAQRRAADAVRRDRAGDGDPRAAPSTTCCRSPTLHMGWGLDAHWGAVAAEHGWPLGVVDATPIRHTRPVAGGYDRAAAVAEARAFLAERPYVRRDEAQETVETYARW